MIIYNNCLVEVFEYLPERFSHVTGFDFFPVTENRHFIIR